MCINKNDVPWEKGYNIPPVINRITIITTEKFLLKVKKIERTRLTICIASIRLS